MNTFKISRRTVPGGAVARALLACTLSATMVAGGLPASAFASESNSSRISSEQTSASSTDALTAFATRLYTEVLDREPDADGLTAQVNALEQGEKPANIAYNYLSSSEYKSKNETAEETVERIYRVMFGRSSDSEGKAMWVSYLEDGMSVRAIIAGFSQAAEYKAYFTSINVDDSTVDVAEARDIDHAVTALCGRLYTKCLGRSYDAGGLNAQAAAIASGTSASQIAINFFTSEEFLGQNLSIAQIVTRAYETMLGREPDAAGKSFWESKMSAWVDEEGLVAAISNLISGFGNSAEWSKICSGVVTNTEEDSASKSEDASKAEASTTSAAAKTETKAEASTTSEAASTAKTETKSEASTTSEAGTTTTASSEDTSKSEAASTPVIVTVADPVATTNLVYNGSAQTGVTCNSTSVTLSGTVKATDAGTYTAYATADSGYIFADGTTSKTITWTIAKATATNPTVISGLTYTGVEQTGVTCSDSSVTLSGTVHASAVGTYTAYAKTDANHVFSNGSTSKTLTWTISTPSLGSVVSIADGWYTVGYAANTSLCLDMTGASMDELACTETYTKNSSDAQKWHFVKQSSGYYTIECGASGMVLGAAGGKTANGTRVDQAYYKSGDTGQLWSIYKVNGKYVFKNKRSGRVLDVSAGSTTSGATVQIWDWNGSGAQGWTLTKTTEPTLKSTTVKSGWYYVNSYVNNEYLDVEGNGTTDGANLHIWGKTSAGCQKWYIKSLGDGTYSLQSGSSWEVGNTEVLDCLYGATTCGTNVHQWTWLNHDTQKWYIKQRTNGAYVFINKASGKRLDVSGGNVDGNVQIWDANNTKAQTWKLTSTTEPAPTLVTDLSSGWYTVNSYVNNEFLDVSGNSSDNGANVQIWGSTGAQGQKWYITNMGNGVYTLRSGSSWRDGKNMVLDCLNGGTANCTNVQQYTWNGTNAQKWYLKRYSTGGYVLENVASGKRLDVSGGNSCSNVQLYDKNQSNAQKWSLNSTWAPSLPVSGNTPTPYSGAAQQSMTYEEREEAHAIFDAYNEWRASKGLNRVAWSDDCCNMAFGSVSGCAAIKNLTHRLGIPSAVQMNYSDILLYSTWRMDANEAVTRWSQSTGHRKMMQCDSATVAGVACYNNSGTWYYAIVYNFSGCNQSGN